MNPKGQRIREGKFIKRKLLDNNHFLDFQPNTTEKTDTTSTHTLKGGQRG